MMIASPPFHGLCCSVTAQSPLLIHLDVATGWGRPSSFAQTPFLTLLISQGLPSFPRPLASSMVSGHHRRGHLLYSQEFTVAVTHLVFRLIGKQQ